MVVCGNIPPLPTVQKDFTRTVTPSHKYGRECMYQKSYKERTPVSPKSLRLPLSSVKGRQKPHTTIPSHQLLPSSDMCRRVPVGGRSRRGHRKLPCHYDRRSTLGETHLHTLQSKSPRKVVSPSRHTRNYFLRLTLGVDRGRTGTGHHARTTT